MSPPIEAKKTVDAVNSTPVSSRSGELEEVKRQLAATLKQNAELSKQVTELTKQVSELTKQGRSFGPTTRQCSGRSSQLLEGGDGIEGGQAA